MDELVHLEVIEQVSTSMVELLFVTLVLLLQEVMRAMLVC